MWWGKLIVGLGGCCRMVFEVPGVDEAADVVGEVAECQGDAE